MGGANLFLNPSYRGHEKWDPLFRSGDKRKKSIMEWCEHVILWGMGDWAAGDGAP